MRLCTWLYILISSIGKLSTHPAMFVGSIHSYLVAIGTLRNSEVRTGTLCDSSIAIGTLHNFSITTCLRAL